MSGCLPYMMRMSATPDISQIAGESRTARMEQRVEPSFKALVKRAAALSGLDETAFVKAAVYARAMEVIDRPRAMFASQAAQQQLLDALDDPAAPTPALSELADDYRTWLRTLG